MASWTRRACPQDVIYSLLHFTNAKMLCCSQRAQAKFASLRCVYTKKAVQSWCSWESLKEDCAVQVMLYI